MNGALAGPGRSTEIILNNTDQTSTLLSIEHDKHYYDIIKNKIQPIDRWEALLVPAVGIVSKYAHIIFNYPKFDLIFVDGRRRVECCFAAMNRIKPDGVIILHDSQRVAYTDIINPFIDIIEHRDETLVFKPKSSLG